MQVHLDAMKDTHLHLACKGVATLTETIQEQARKISFLEDQKSWNAYRIAPELLLYLENIELFIGHGGCSKKRTEGDS